MGVPAFFRWLCMRCPKILVDGLEPSLFEEATSEEFPKSAIDIDNLYLDMNGLIHPCTHPENLVITICKIAYNISFFRLFQNL